MTREMSSEGVFVPPVWNAAYAFADSVCAWFGLPFASSDLMPPPGRLTRNRPIVPMNQRATTGHRWREHHIATRTVAGSRVGDTFVAWVICPPPPALLPRSWTVQDSERSSNV